MKNAYITNNYNDYLKDKKVIIVGSARYLQGKKLGNWIDSFDVVVRINFGVSVNNPEDLGTKTNIVYNYLSDNMFTNDKYIDDVIRSGAEFVTTMHYSLNHLSNFTNLLRNRVKHLVVATNFFQGMNAMMYLAPQTGTATIQHLLLTDLKSLNVVGFDYYQTGCVDGYRGLYGEDAINVPINTKDHNQLSQLKYIAKIIDERLILDNKLKELIRSKDMNINNLNSKISFVIPFKPCNNERDIIFKWMINRIALLYPDSEIIVSKQKNDEQNNNKPFNRGKVLNKGAIHATKDILVLCDSDIIFDYDIIMKSCELLEKNAWVIPFTHYCAIVQPDTERILKSSPDVDLDTVKPFKASIFKHTLGAINIIKRKDFLSIGGFDERLTGWGFDDNVFAHKADVLLGKHGRLESEIYHMYHDAHRSWEDENTKRNKILWNEIEKITDKLELKEYYKLEEK